MPQDWSIYVGESEGNPLLVMLDRTPAREAPDRSRPWAVMVELKVPRVDGNALPPQTDWPALEAIEAALVRDLATDEDDWRYVVRLYGEGLCRFCFYAPRSSAAPQRVSRALATLDDEFAEFTEDHRTQVQSDPIWSAYRSFFPPDDAKGETAHGGSFRDDPPYDPTGAPTSARSGSEPSGTRRPWSGQPRREEQPYRGEDVQNHPDD